MVFKSLSLVFFVAFLTVGFLLIPINSALAGFGISPPYVRNDNLTRGSTFKQKIILVRDRPDEDWKVNLIFNVPEANKWFSVDKGKEFILKRGEKQTPVLIKVNVPSDAKFKRYKGFIRVKTTPLKTQEKGTVSIILGGQIDVDLNVAKEIFDFDVKGVKVSDLEEGHKWLLWYFPGIIKFSIRVENVGNVKAAPSKVHFDIYDNQEKNLLESIETAKFDRKVEPFKTEWVTARLGTRLHPGSYWARYKVYRKDDVVNRGRIHLSILPRGSISEYQGANFFDLPLKDKLITLLLTAAILIVIGYGVYKSLGWGRKRRRA